MQTDTNDCKTGSVHTHFVVRSEKRFSTRHTKLNQCSKTRSKKTIFITSSNKCTKLCMLRIQRESESFKLLYRVYFYVLWICFVIFFYEYESNVYCQKYLPVRNNQSLKQPQLVCIKPRKNTEIVS